MPYYVLFLKRDLYILYNRNIEIKSTIYSERNYIHKEIFLFSENYSKSKQKNTYSDRIYIYFLSIYIFKHMFNTDKVFALLTKRRANRVKKCQSWSSTRVVRIVHRRSTKWTARKIPSLETLSFIYLKGYIFASPDRISAWTIILCGKHGMKINPTSVKLYTYTGCDSICEQNNCCIQTGTYTR